jgi:hypothetical protein
MGPTSSFVLLARHPPSYGIDPRRWRWRRLTADLRDGYRPQLHYMRGPGPKWREANARRDRRLIR